MQKTIKIDYAYIEGEAVYIDDYRTDFLTEKTYYEKIKLQYAVGKTAILYSVGEDYKLCFDIEGMRCNSNPNIRKQVGWLGSYNGVSSDAYGLVKIVKITPCKNGVKILVKT